MFVGGTKDDLIKKTGGGSGGGDSPSSPSPKNGSSSGPVSKEGLSKGVNKADVDYEEAFEARDGELTVEEEADLGYGTPVFLLEEGPKGCGKSSDWAHEDIPRPVADEKTTFITTGPETKKGIIDRWGEVPEFVDIFNIGRFHDKNDPSSAGTAIAALEKFLDDKIEEGGLCNVIFDDLERFHEKLAIDKCRSEFGYEAGEHPFDDTTQDFYKRRKVLDDLLLDKLLSVAEHLLVVSGYDGEWSTEEKDVDGDTRPVKVYEPARWVGYFEKPFDVVLLRDKVEDADEGQGDRYFAKVRSSKVNRLFPEGARQDVTGPGVATFWQQFEAQEENGDTMADAAKETDN